MPLVKATAAVLLRNLGCSSWRRLTAALALVFVLAVTELLCRAVAVGAHHPVRYPRFVHAPLHSLHDEIQQRVHCFAHIVPVRCTRFKVRNPKKKKR